MAPNPPTLSASRSRSQLDAVFWEVCRNSIVFPLSWRMRLSGGVYLPSGNKANYPHKIWRSFVLWFPFFPRLTSPIPLSFPPFQIPPFSSHPSSSLLVGVRGCNLGKSSKLHLLVGGFQRILIGSTNSLMSEQNHSPYFGKKPSAYFHGAFAPSLYCLDAPAAASIRTAWDGQRVLCNSFLYRFDKRWIDWCIFRRCTDKQWCTIG